MSSLQDGLETFIPAAFQFLCLCSSWEKSQEPEKVSDVCERRERAAEEVLQGSEDSGGSLYDDDADDDLLGDAVTTPWNPAECQR